MAIDFPSSPTPGETYTSGNTTWSWDGTSWTVTNLISELIASRFVAIGGWFFYPRKK